MALKQIKRPLGLSQAIKQKKAKQDTEGSENAVNFEVCEDEDPDNQLTQIQALFNGYSNSDKSSPKLLYGIIHECDALLRQNVHVCPELYKVYARALIECGRFEDVDRDVDGTQTQTDFVHAAIEKTDKALEKYAEDVELQLIQLIAKTELVFLELAKSKPKGTKVQCASEIVSQINKIHGHVGAKLELSQRMTPFILEVESDSSLFTNESFCSAKDCFRQFQTHVWQQTRDSSDQDQVRMSFRAEGELLARQSCDVLNEIAENDTDDNTDTSEWLSKAQRAAELVLESKTETLYPLVAETYIAMGNVQDLDSKEQMDLYKQAVKYLKRAQRLGLGDYTEMIEELTDSS